MLHLYRRAVRRIRLALGLPCSCARRQRRPAFSGEFTVVERNGIAHVVPRAKAAR